ncbi:hypothetical protein [Thermococcus pacificus]|uniref:Uncharacterized protein n=1 Tax=Thermococcus pacificus TaxID=71998 RepID=A0A218P6I2_9EURY|nr:hypothetical protein [Thermococcus pacificus]ASJ06377.1 hypothetical protein A3L08_03030 [Thermococcus pacificus]
MRRRTNHVLGGEVPSTVEYTARSNPLEADYYRQFPEIFDGHHVYIPDDILHQISRKERKAMRKIRRGKMLSAEEAETILSLIKKIRRHHHTLELSDEEVLEHISIITQHVLNANRKNPGPWGETSFYNMRRIVRAYAEMKCLNLATLFEEALSRKLISLEEFSGLVYNLMNARKNLRAGGRVRLVDGSYITLRGTEPFFHWAETSISGVKEAAL